MNIDLNYQTTNLFAISMLLENDIFNSKKYSFINDNKFVNKSPRSVRNIYNPIVSSKTYTNLRSPRLSLDKIQTLPSFKKSDKNYLASEYAELAPENKKYSITINKVEAPLNDKRENNCEVSIKRGM